MQSSAKPAEASILTINGGSSSIKFALYRIGNPLKRGLNGTLARIGFPNSDLTFHDAKSISGHGQVIQVKNAPAAPFLVDWFEKNVDLTAVKAVGHRVVHGMQYTEPQRITPELLDELNRIKPYDPDHLPLELEVIEAFCSRYPTMEQVACFDTAFHRTMPRVAKLLPIPRRFAAAGIERYGFHGLSYDYLMEELERVAGKDAAQGRVILAHLGNGASLAAVRGGRSMDTSMGFTPAGGVPMGTRPGDLDPGAAWFMMHTGNLTTEQFNHIINHESGLLGISETSSDMRDLMERQANDTRAAEAVELFCYQVRKWIGAFAAVLGGLDTLVFAGGIGENSAEVRTRACSGLGFLGIQLDETRNAANTGVISADRSPATVRVIRTDEDLMIARAVWRLLGEEEQAKETSNG